MRHKAVVGFAVMAVLLTSKSYADPIVVTFDEQSPGLVSPFEYLPLGLFLVSFTSGAEFGGFTVDTSASATTPPNAAFGRFFPNLMGRFFDPVLAPLGGAATNFLSFSVVNTSGDSNGLWRAAIFGWNDELLDERTGTFDQQVVFSRNGIRSFRFLAPTGQVAGIDTLSFNPPAVPEPTTLFLVGTGLALVASRRLRGASRRRQH